MRKDSLEVCLWLNVRDDCCELHGPEVERGAHGEFVKTRHFAELQETMVELLSKQVSMKIFSLSSANLDSPTQSLKKIS